MCRIIMVVGGASGLALENSSAKFWLRGTNACRKTSGLVVRCCCDSCPNDCPALSEPVVGACNSCSGSTGSQSWGAIVLKELFDNTGFKPEVETPPRLIVDGAFSARFWATTAVAVSGALATPAGSQDPSGELKRVIWEARYPRLTDRLGEHKASTDLERGSAEDLLSSSSATNSQKVLLMTAWTMTSLNGANCGRLCTSVALEISCLP
mmetsp:Transcript_41315/g.106813  ORF Transcript_41315/g.106813 Transcript_41315/m.106813 type:complete len:209 (+) Transcript_41315:114-740(+)